MSHVLFRLRLSSRFNVLAAALLASIAGCNDGAGVSSYKTQKPAAVFDANHVEQHAKRGRPASAESKAGPSRMIGAIILRPGDAWTFKLQGDPRNLAEVEKEVEAFLAELTFTPSRPEWELPDGWKERPGSGLRFATLLVGEKQLPISVLKLPPQDLLLNVNRWRGQVGLGDLAAESDLVEKNGVTEEKLSTGETMHLVDITGKSSGGGMGGGGPFSGGPFSGGAGGDPHAGLGMKPPKRSAPAPGPKLAYDVPEGWSSTAASPPRLATFVVGEGDEEVEIGVYEFGQSSHEMTVGIVNLWIGEVGQTKLPPDSDLGDVTEGKKVAGLPTEVADLAAPGDDPGRKGIVGAVIRGLDKSWVVKMSGPRGLVEKERPKFDAFLESLTLKGDGTSGDGENGNGE